MKLSKLIASKKFDYINSNIKDDIFPEPKNISSDYRLYHFNRDISSEAAIKEMVKDGYRAANIYELLKWPDWNEKDLVVALGSVGEVNGARRVPRLGRYDSKRDLNLNNWDGDWDDYYRFLAVAEDSNSALKTSETKKKELGNLSDLTLESAIKTVKEAGYVIYKQI